ncbi:MAG: hypothetical protein JWO30_57 [Fibrobacteres bacterium]|nr:hypothetical protein [Fibrobacterota bacterium]
MEFTWNLGKNSKLKEERGVSFEQVVRCILAGNFKILDNASVNHPGQDVFVVSINRTVWLVPFRKTKRGYFLHTIMKQG